MSSLLSRICQLSKQALKFAKPQRGFFTFLFFLALSGGFWLSTALNETYDKEVGFCVSVENVPSNVVLSDDFDDTIRVVLHDKGFTLLTYEHRGGVQSIVLNFGTYARSNGKVVVSASELQKLVRQQLFSSTIITSVKPERLEFGYSQGVSKKVPVRLSGNIRAADNYYLAFTQVSPSNVVIYGSKAQLDSIHYVTTEYLNIPNVTDTIRQQVALKTIKGIKIMPKTVNLLLCSDILTESSVEVPIVAVNVPEGTHLRTFPLMVNVKYTVGVSQFRSISTSQFRVEVDYQRIMPGHDKCPIRLVKTPDGVASASLEVSEVDYLIEN